MAKKEDIQAALIKLINEKGINNLSINDILTTANIGSGTFYNLYENKDEAIEDLIFTTIFDGVNEIKIEIPNNIAIDSVKPYIMAVLDNIINVMTTKNANMELIMKLLPAFHKKKDFKNKENVKKYQEMHKKAIESWAWMDAILAKGQSLNEIVDLDPQILGKMIINTFSKIFFPQMAITNGSEHGTNNPFGEKTISPEQINILKECIWNMIAIPNKK